MKVGIVGTGAIGSEVARAASAMDGVDAVLLYDIDPDATKQLRKLPRTKVAASAAALVEGVDLVIECANKGVVQTVVRDALAKGKKTMLLTIGALADDKLREELIALAKKHGGKIYLPSGAVMGVDGVKAAAEGDLKSVTLVTTKPPAGIQKGTDRWTMLFSGPAREAVEQFPKNVNVAATLSLAGLGFDQTHVQVAIDPLATRNSHKVIIEGSFGRARIEVENLPSPTNPATSYLASLSAIALLRRIVSPVEIGA
ncbi:MAG: aspartate dehydrogenase [Thermoplasmata archaeon]|nr:aspartate dehydrogenase [Thermoplasmata archaeon]MEA3165996.1 aspartate dehydrogenase [Thermoplasmata archaeon]